MPAPFSELATADGLLLDLLATSLAPIQLLLPAYGPAGELTGFTLEYLNPAGQELVNKSGQPASQYRGGVLPPPVDRGSARILPAGI